ncbi:MULTISPECIES: acyltransferase family protein [Edwardsiella]|uniref:Exopolysaccharide production protein ExoZ n=2 Tax=Edwardsiella anguillarum TaxID=1821960 RepID=A0A076LRD1_9GAMM|nr:MULTISPECIES: acyltransferase [Edwardsiella]AIJ10516.1 Exopolysaccharide production protein ExoZ [Edwardsiella anguillarum ET080813]UBU94568.1 acyltransferase [Edwardsiella sp. LADL05-105]UOU77711.1 acyltransferase [Edwardsiella anguillarum]WHP82350.1 acyltransferase [Edwardsiella anguillarum]WHP86149.1 acyltransferase [Edwardsiella anguillarum]
MMVENNDKKLTSLQVVRGIAALLVVFFHYRFFLKDNGAMTPDFWEQLLSPGIIGVNIFFVLSGFIIACSTSKYQKGVESFKLFAKNRILRIVPLYYFGLLVAFLLGGAMSTFHYSQKIENLISALTFTVYDNNVSPHYIDDSGMYNVRWTLNYEIYFYFVFAVCMLFRSRLTFLLVWFISLTQIIPALLGFTPTLSVSGYHFDYASYGFFTNPIALEFVVGVIFGLLYLKIQNNIREHNYLKYSFLPAAIFLVILVYIRIISPFDILASVIIGLIILSLALYKKATSRFTIAFVYLGDISYSLYLLHNPIGSAIFKRVDGANHPYFWFMIAVLSSIAISHFTYRYIEVSLTNFLKSKLP